MTEDERAIRDLIATWIGASTTGDTETVLGLMADDVVFLTAGQAPFGKERFAALQQDLSATSIEGHSNVREVKVIGEWAFAWTELKISMTQPGSEPIRRRGNTLSIFQKLPGGRWVLARDANMLVKEN